MKELKLKYGCNSNQKPARVFMKNGELPIKVLNGNPGYINLLDAFNSCQLVKELKEATGLAAASFIRINGLTPSYFQLRSIYKSFIAVFRIPNYNSASDY